MLFEIFGLPALAAVLIAAVLAAASQRLWPDWLDRRIGWSLAAAAGYVAGYLLLRRDWAPLIPQHSWHWLPCLALIATICSALRLPPHE